MVRIVYFLLLQVMWAHADFAPSVWGRLEQQSPSVFTQLQEGRVDVQNTKIEKVELRSGTVYLTVDGGKTFQLCTADTDRAGSEAERALQINQRFERLKQAEKNKEAVQTAFRGPFNPCATPTSL